MSKRLSRILHIMGALAGLSAAPAAILVAQQPDSSTLAQLRPNRLVRIESPALGRVQGTVVRQSASEILLANGGEHVIPLESIQRVWVRGRHTGTGAIIGGVLGAGGGLFLGLIARALCETGCSDAPVSLTLLGAAAGAGTGALIGTAFPRWKELH